MSNVLYEPTSLTFEGYRKYRDSIGAPVTAPSPHDPFTRGGGNSLTYYRLRTARALRLRKQRKATQTIDEGVAAGLNRESYNALKWVQGLISNEDPTYLGESKYEDASAKANEYASAEFKKRFSFHEKNHDVTRHLKKIDAGNYDHNINPPTFFSGVDVEVYISIDGETPIHFDNVISIGAETTQLQRPVYGYNQYLPDKVLKGIAITRGQIICAFKSPQYLYQMLVRQRMDDIISLEEQKEDNLRNRENWLKLSTEEKLEFIQKSSSGSLDDVIAGHKADTPTAVDQRKRDLNKLFSTNIIPDVEYANDTKFDIIIVYKNADLVNLSGGEHAVGTGEIIHNVRLSGRGKTINADGKPIMEQYEFVTEGDPKEKELQEIENYVTT